MRNSPTLASSLGLDKGPNAALKSKFDTDPAPVGRRKDLARNRRAIAELRAISPTTLSDAARLNREVVLYSLETATAAPSRWDIDSAQRPYRITQQGGAYFSSPDFLNTAHTINNAADAEAYLSRLNQFSTVLDNDTAEQRAQAARGFLAPAWAIDLTLGQMRKLRNVAPEVNTWATRSSGGPRTRASPATGSGALRRLSQAAVYPALDRQIAAMGSLEPTTRPGDGAWRLQRAKSDLCRGAASGDHDQFTPAEVHQMGLTRWPSSTELDKILRTQGFTQGSVGRGSMRSTRPQRSFTPTATPDGQSYLST